MTSHVLFADQDHAANASVGQSAKQASATVPVSFASQFLDVLRAVFTDPAAASEPNHPWLNANIRSRMSPRAQRLMRSDY